MMDKNREAFEAEYSKVMGTPVTVLRILRDNESYKETEGDRLSLSWLMWQASRQAIEIPVPDRKNASYFIDDSFGNKDLAAIWNSCRNEFLKGVTSLGIRVKGNEE